MENKQDIQMNLHDLNKAVIIAMPELPQEVIEKKMEEMLDWTRSVADEYFMLLSNEKRDFTIFKTKIKSEKFIEEILEVVKSRGVIKAIDAVTGAYEIWIDDVFYALFPYDLGVIEVV